MNQLMAIGHKSELRERAISDAAAANVFETLVTEHYLRLVKIAYAVVRDASAAQDIAQDGCALLWQQRAAVFVLPAPERWLMKTCWLLAKNQRRRQHRQAARSNVSLREGGDESELAAVAAPTNDPVVDLIARRVWDALPATERELLWMHAIAGCSASELGELFGISEVAVRKRLQRVRASAVRASGEVAFAGVSLPAIAALRRAPLVNIATPTAPIALKLALAAALIVVPAIVYVMASAGDQRTDNVTALARHENVGTDAPVSGPETSEQHAAVPFWAAWRTIDEDAAQPTVAHGASRAPSGELTPSLLPREAATIDLNFQDAPVEDIIQLLVDVIGPTLVKAELNGTITMKFQNVIALDALDYVLERVGATREDTLQYTLVDDPTIFECALAGAPRSLAFSDASFEALINLLTNGAPVMTAQPPELAALGFTGEFANTAPTDILRAALRQAGVGCRAEHAYLITSAS